MPLSYQQQYPQQYQQPAPGPFYQQAPVPGPYAPRPSAPRRKSSKVVTIVAIVVAVALFAVYLVMSTRQQLISFYSTSSSMPTKPKSLPQTPRGEDPSKSVSSISIFGVAAGGKPLIFGFTSQNEPYLARMTASGQLDQAYPVGSLCADKISLINALAQPDGKLLFECNSSVSGAPTIVRFTEDGSLDKSFHFDGDGLDATASVYLSLLPDGKLLVAGHFADGQKLIRLTSDGSPDPSFKAQLNAGTSAVSYVAVQPDGKAIVQQTAKDGTTLETSLIRLNTDGSIDSTFTWAVDSLTGTPSSIVPAPDGKLLVSSVKAHQLIRLKADGSLDRSFKADVNGLVDFGEDGTFYAQSDGSVILAAYGDRPLLIKLKADGSFAAQDKFARGVRGLTEGVWPVSDSSVAVVGIIFDSDKEPRGFTHTLTISDWSTTKDYGSAGKRLNPGQQQPTGPNAGPGSNGDGQGEGDQGGDDGSQDGGDSLTIAF